MLFKVDLHIHTPASYCYYENFTGAELIANAREIIDKAKKTGLDAIAITDHNTVKGIEPVMLMGIEAGLQVYPGIEISAQGGHIIALWDVNVSLEKLNNLLLILGYDESNEGQGYFETNTRMEEVFNHVSDIGGMVIAAHIDRRPKGLMVSDDLSLIDKQKIYDNPNLKALEITIEANKKAWNNGAMGSFRNGKCCIQCSDAHAPNEVGRRLTYIDTPDISFQSISLAFKEYTSRVFFPSEIALNSK